MNDFSFQDTILNSGKEIIRLMTLRSRGTY